LNWDRYIKYRITPDFFSTDLVILINKKKWDSLSPKTRDILTRTVVEHETSSLRDLQALWKKEQAELAKRGIKTVNQSADAAKRFNEGARREPAAHEGAHGEGRRHGELREGRQPLHAGPAAQVTLEAAGQGVRRRRLRHGLHRRLPHGGDDGDHHARRDLP